jgi:hypothetical protein
MGNRKLLGIPTGLGKAGVMAPSSEILRLKCVAQRLDREIADALGMSVDGMQGSLKRRRQES